MKSNACVQKTHRQKVTTLLPVGEYSVSVEAKGFRKVTQAGIELTANQKFTADFKLEVGDVTQEVTVTAEEPGGKGEQPTLIAFGQFPQLQALTEEDFNSAEWREEDIVL